MEILEDTFRLTLVDLTLLSSRKAPSWVAQRDTTPPQGEFFLWKQFWRHAHLYVPGEAWYLVNRQRLRDAYSGHFYEQPWHTSMRRMLKFVQRLFWYPEQDPSDPNADPRDFPHPARLRDWNSPPQSIEFEILCRFDPNLPGRNIFKSREEYLNLRALLWLFKLLKCHHVENRHRLNIVLKWKDIRYGPLKKPILECKGGSENIYADKDEKTKAAIPLGLGIQERYMEVINEGLVIWTTYLLERERVASMTQDQRNNLPPVPNTPKTISLGTYSARKDIPPHNVVVVIANQICHNLQNKVYHDALQVPYVEFWQRVTLNIPPQPTEQSENGDPTWDDAWNLESYLKDKAHEAGNPTNSAMSEFAANMRSFVAKYNVEPEGHIYFSHSVVLLCNWDGTHYRDLIERPTARGG